MADGRRTPPGEGFDRITYLPIDRSRAAERVYAPWDPRARRPEGGMRVGGEPGVFVAAEELPALAPDAVARACDAVIGGRGVYPALLVLSRATLADFPVLLDATVSEEVRQRWERLWVLSPFFARLSRAKGAAASMVPLLLEDLGAVHLLGKFGEQNNPAVKRLFARLREPLVQGLLARLYDSRLDPRRASLVSGIIAAVESLEEPLRRLMPPELSEAQRGALLDMLYLRPAPRGHRTLKAARVRDRLLSMRR